MKYKPYCSLLFLFLIACGSESQDPILKKIPVNPTKGLVLNKISIEEASRMTCELGPEGSVELNFPVTKGFVSVNIYLMRFMAAQSRELWENNLHGRVFDQCLLPTLENYQMEES